MSHDFAKKKRTLKKRRRKKPTIPAWTWLLTGLTAGLFIAFLVYLAELAPAAHDANLTALAKPTKAESTADQKPKQKSKAAANKEPKKPRFDFYTLLPKREVPVPDIPIEEMEPAEKFSYLLQAGSFRRYEDADKLRAKLILMGLETNIETGTGRGEQTWHRILVGPFSSRSKLAKARSVLINKGINTMLIKRKLS